MAVRTAKRCSQGLETERVICENYITTGEQKSKPPRLWLPQRRSNSKSLFRKVNGEIHDSAIGLDLNFLLDRLVAIRLAMGRCNGVLAGRNVLDGVFAVLVGHGEIRIIHDRHVSEHPGMNVAFEPEEIFLFGKTDRDVRRARSL